MKEKRVLASERASTLLLQAAQAKHAISEVCVQFFFLKRRKLLELEKTKLRVATGHMCFRSAHSTIKTQQARAKA